MTLRAQNRLSPVDWGKMGSQRHLICDGGGTRLAVWSQGCEVAVEARCKPNVVVAGRSYDRDEYRNLRRRRRSR